MQSSKVTVLGARGWFSWESMLSSSRVVSSSSMLGVETLKEEKKECMANSY